MALIYVQLLCSEKDVTEKRLAQVIKDPKAARYVTRTLALKSKKGSENEVRIREFAKLPLAQRVVGTITGHPLS